MRRTTPGDRRSTRASSSASRACLGAPVCLELGATRPEEDGLRNADERSTPPPAPAEPDLPADLIRRVRADHDRFARTACPRTSRATSARPTGSTCRRSYAGVPIRNPWGKASGQLSLNASQVEEAADAGLGFVVLKTVIAQDAAGRQSMAAWAIRESRMVAEPIVGRAPARRAGRSPGRAGAGGSRSTSTSSWSATAARSAATRHARRPLGQVPPPGARGRAPGGRRNTSRRPGSSC